MRELVFRADGRFSATWRPFGDYRDYWGVWTYDDRSGVLTLNVDDANYEPGDRVLSGEVSADAHELNLGGISLGSPERGPRCTAPFRR